MMLNSGTDHCAAGVYWILGSWLSTTTVLGTAETRRMFLRESAQRASIQTNELPGSDGGMDGALEATMGAPEGRRDQGVRLSDGASRPRDIVGSLQGCYLSR